MLDLDRLRADTPACDRLTHLNNAGAALPSQPVVDRQIAHLRREAEIGGYEAHDEASEELAAVHAAVATVLNATAPEISLHPSASAAWRAAFGGMLGTVIRPGDRIITCVAEYGNNLLAYLEAKERFGVEVDVAPDDEHGQIDVGALERMITPGTKLISISHVPTHGGLVNPAAAVGEVARRHGLLYLLDACQSVGQMPVDVEAIGCDILSFTGRKFVRGPRGTAALYVRDSALERVTPEYPDLEGVTTLGADRFELSPDSRRFTTFEANVAGVLGLGVALRYALDIGLDAIWARIQLLAAHLRAQLAATPGVTVRDKGAVRGGIVTFTVAGETPASVKARLAAQRINVSTTSAEATCLDPAAGEERSYVRASVHAYNTIEELDRTVEAVSRATR